MSQLSQAGGQTGQRTDGGKFLTFRLAGESYGLPILKVREIIGMMSVTCVPRTPDWVEGVVNLRGSVIPVIDLRRKFGMDRAERDEQTCIVIVETCGIEVGIVIDSVSEVLDIDGGDIEEAPSLGSGVDSSFILAMGKTPAGVVILLDLSNIVQLEQLQEIGSTFEQQNT